MHVNVQHRFNPDLGQMAPYFRLKRSCRDVAGKVHSLILLNIGFEPGMNYRMVKRIADVLTDWFTRRSEVHLFLWLFILLGREHHPIRAQAERDQMLLDGGDRATNVYPKDCNDPGRECLG